MKRKGLDATKDFKTKACKASTIIAIGGRMGDIIKDKTDYVAKHVILTKGYEAA